MRIIAAVFVARALVAIPAAVSQPPTARARLVEEMRLDATGEDFSVVTRIAVNRNGDIAIPLRQDFQVRLYDASGKRIAAVGRRGAGPGEFQNMLPVGWVADTLWVFDPQLRRTTFLSRDGRVMRTTVLPTPTADIATTSGAPGKFLFFTPLAFFGDGAMLAQGRVELPAVPGKPDVSERALVHLSHAGAPRLAARPPAYEDARWYMSIDGFGMAIPFVQAPLVVVSPDGERFAYLNTEHKMRGGTFTVSLFRANGTQIATQSHEFDGTPIPQIAIDSALAALVRSFPQSRDRPPDLAQRFEAMARERIPAVHAPVVSMVFGTDETTWLTMRPTEAGTVALALDARGSIAGSVLLPARSRIGAASAEALWLLENDTDGLTSVVRYRVEGLRCAAPRCGNE